MKRLLLLLALLVALPAAADVMAEAPMADGAMVYLHDTPGPCIGQALLAEYVSPQGARISGCWVIRPGSGHVAVVFLDGDMGAIPTQALRPPKKT